MQITYITHSCFVVELTETVLIFDYYKGILPPFKKGKKYYVFASHSHYDHFNAGIFAWREQAEEITYILSDDIRTDQSGPAVHFVRANQSLTLDGIGIRTLKSTDEGVAFLIEAEGVKLYHAGDLNWWHWDGEPDPWNPEMESAYKKEIDKLDGMHVDAAFVPVDPRLAYAFYWGVKYFTEHVKADRIYPMHLWDKYEYIEQLKQQPELAGCNDSIVGITGENQSFSQEIKNICRD